MQAQNTESLQLYQPLYHGTSALLMPGDYLKPGGLNVVKTCAVFSTTRFIKALACALLSKRGLKTVGERYYNSHYSYCYLFDRWSKNLILHPLFHWDDCAPAFVYQMDKISFFKSTPKGDEYTSYKPARIEEVSAIITPEYFKKLNVGLYVAKSENTLADLIAIYDQTIYRSGHGLRKEIMDATCTKIV